MSIKISELPQATSVGSSDIVPIVQGGTTKQATAGMMKLDVYSTTEQRVGTWIDGKPLYRLVIEDNTDNTSYSIDISSHNVEFVTDIRGVAKDPSSYTEMPICSYVTSSAYFSVIVTSVNSGQNIALGIRTVAGYSNYTKYIIVEYTKTTDSAS